MKNISRILSLLAIVSLIIIAFIFKDPHRSRAALIPTQIITNQNLLAEVNLEYHFEETSVTEKYKHLIPEKLQTKGIQQLENFLEWFTQNYYATVFEVKNYARLSPEYPDLLIEQYKKKEEKGSCYNDAILFSFLAQVNGYKARQINFINKDGYGGSGHTMVEIWLHNLNEWVLVDIRNSVMFYENNHALSALDLRKKVLTLDSASFYNSISIIQYTGYNIVKQELYSFYKPNCSDFLVSSTNNHQTKVASSTFYTITHFLSSQNSIFLEKTSRFLRSLFDKSRVNYLLIDEYSGNKKYNIWYYAFNTAATFLLVYLLYFLVDLIQFVKSKLKRSQSFS